MTQTTSINAACILRRTSNTDFEYRVCNFNWLMQGVEGRGISQIGTDCTGKGVECIPDSVP